MESNLVAFTIWNYNAENTNATGDNWCARHTLIVVFLSCAPLTCWRRMHDSLGRTGTVRTLASTRAMRRAWTCCQRRPRHLSPLQR